ncbi:hypothetical protein V2J09_010296 [Rumex salicifolius]
MACNYYNFSVSNAFRSSNPFISQILSPSSSSSSSSSSASTSQIPRFQQSLRYGNQTSIVSSPYTPAPLTYPNFTWDDVFRLPFDDPSDLKGFFEKINSCNRNLEKQWEFIPFVVEGHIVGYIHNRFFDVLKKFPDVFVFRQNGSYGGSFGGYVTLHPYLKTCEDRTSAVASVINYLGEEIIPGHSVVLHMNQLYPVAPSFGSPVLFLLERAAATYFGTKIYCVYVNGYVEKDGETLLWVGKRSPLKPSFPGMLDYLVAGGLPHGISPTENILKECEEEAAIPSSILKEVKSAGAVSYADIDGHRYRREVHFCFDLKLPEGFLPKNLDGEVESFELVPVPLVATVIKRTDFFRPNCSPGIIDFLVRHGHITPEAPEYLKLLQSLRMGDCS